MIRSANAETEQDDEAVMQNFLFKVNVLLFFGTIGVIKAGEYSCLGAFKWYSF